MNRVRLEILQWYALLGGALAWTAQHVLGYFLSVAGCSGPVSHWGIDARLWGGLLTGVTVAAIVAAQAAAVLVYRETASVEEDEAGPLGRLHFFALAALVGNVLFFVLVALDATGSLYHLPCRQG
jgi:hypothetical protein